MSIKLTFADVLKGGNGIPLSRVYVIENEHGEVIYVGKSKDAEERVLSHIGRGMWNFGISPIGRHLLDNLPHSKEWGITMYTLEDCKREYPYSPKACGDWMVDEFEGRMIQRFAPRFNSVGRYGKMSVYTKSRVDRDNDIIEPGITDNLC